MDLDEMARRVQVGEEKRRVELEEAFRDRDALMHLIVRDSALVVSSIGGYMVPLGIEECDVWIRRRMFNDPSFVAKVRCLENLVWQYTEAALETASNSVDDSPQMRGGLG